MEKENNNTGIIKLFLGISIIVLIVGLGVIAYNVVLTKPENKDTNAPKECTEKATTMGELVAKFNNIDLGCDETTITYEETLGDVVNNYVVAIAKSTDKYNYSLTLNDKVVFDYANITYTTGDTPLLLKKIGNYNVLAFKNLTTNKENLSFIYSNIDTKTYLEIDSYTNTENSFAMIKLSDDINNCICKVESASLEDAHVIGITYTLTLNDEGILDEATTDYTCLNACSVTE